MTTLSVKNLTIKIEKKVLIKNLNIDFSAGEVWGILGDNGTGKTSFLHVLAGLEKPSKGRILIRKDTTHCSFETNIVNLKPKIRAQKIGILFQESHFDFPNTVFDTVMSGRFPYEKNWFFESEENIEAVQKALKLMQLEKFYHRPVNYLSGGEKQRAALATLLAQDPDTFLLDEPTNHLDTKQRLRTLALFQKLAKKRNKLVIMVLHEMDLIEQFCDKTLKM